MKNLIIIQILFISFSALGQNESISNPEVIINKFFELYGKGDSNEALDYIFKTNKWMDESKPQIDGLKLKLNNSVGLMGTYYGYEPIIDTEIGKNLKLYTFLIKYDRQPLRFSFLMYKPNDQWRLQNFGFDDDLDSELEEAARAYRLEENIPGY